MKRRLVYYPMSKQTGVLTEQGTQCYEVKASLADTRAHLVAHGYEVID